MRVLLCCRHHHNAPRALRSNSPSLITKLLPTTCSGESI